MKRLHDTRKMSHEDWLRARQDGLGGSDMSAIVGLNKYSSPMAVYIDKICHSFDQEENEAMHWGNVLEPVVAKEFSLRTGLRCRKENYILQHPEKEFALANIDRLIIDKDVGNGVLECKTAGFMSSSQWDDDKVPEAYQIQLQWYLGVTGLQYGYVACLIGGQKFVYKRLERDDEMIGHLLEIGEDFWQQHVVAKLPPAIDGMDKTTDWLNNYFASDPNLVEIEVPEALPWVERYKAADEQCKLAKEAKSLAANNLRHLMGQRETIFCDKYQPSWKSVTRKSFDEKRFREECPEIYQRYASESNYRRFSVNKRKGY